MQLYPKKIKDYMYIVTIVVAAFVVLIPSGVSFAEFERPEEITVVAVSEWKPYSYIDERGDLKGVLIDYWRAWGKVNNVNIDIDVESSWTEALRKIQNGEADLHMGLFYTEERDQSIDFGNSIMDLMTGIYVKDGVEAFNIDDLSKMGIGVTKNNYARRYIEQNYPNVQIHLYEDVQSVMDAAKSGEIKAVCIDYHNNFRKISFYYPEMEGFELLQTLYTQPLRVGARKGDSDLLNFVNEGISNMSDLHLRDIKSKWEYMAIYLTRNRIQEIILGVSLSIIAFLVINTIVLRRKIAKGVRRLAQSEKSYKKLVQLCPDGIFVQSEGNIIYANEAALDITGYNSYVHVIGKNIVDFIVENKKDDLNKRIDSVHRLNLPVVTLGKKFIQKHGETIDVEMTISSMVYKDNKSELIMVRDISKRMEREREKQKALRNKLKYERLKTEFFANVSHEIRTPINIMLGAIQILDKEFAKEDREEECGNCYSKYSALITQNAYRLIRLVNNLIDTTKMDVGFFKMDFKRCNMVQVVEDITMSVVSYIREKGIEVVFDTQVEEKDAVCDAENIERVMLNLLSNAVKFTDEGGKIFVNVFDRGEDVRISVRDTGIGIPEHAQEGIFERFRQAQQLSRKKKEGSGIGLSLVKSIVEAHGGSVGLRSEEGEGCEFIIDLPCNAGGSEFEELPFEASSIEDRMDKINIEFSDL